MVSNLTWGIHFKLAYMLNLKQTLAVKSKFQVSNLLGYTRFSFPSPKFEANSSRPIIPLYIYFDWLNGDSNSLTMVNSNHLSYFTSSIIPLYICLQSQLGSTIFFENLAAVNACDISQCNFSFI